MAGLMERLGLEEDVPIESGMVSRSIEGAQKKVEGRNFDTRKNVLEYDDVMNQQRKTVYALRKQILEGRYQPELSEEDKKQGLTSAPPTSSGPLTVPELTKELQPKIAEVVNGIFARMAERDAAVARGERVGEERPTWRVLRHEIWRQFGAHLDLERTTERGAEAVIEQVTAEVAQSLICQRERIHDLCDTLLARVIETACPSTTPSDEWDLDALEDALREQFASDFELEHGPVEDLVAQAWKVIEARLTTREKELTQPWFFYFARSFQLEEIDAQWIEHLKTMEALREGIGLQGYGQKDPKKEYKKAGYDLFADMMARVQSNVVTKLFRVEFKREEEAIPALQVRERQMIEAGAANKVDEDEEEHEIAAKAAPQQRRPRPNRGQPARKPGEPQAASADAKAETVRRDKPKVGRNDPCPCGSGKKYKKCHGRDEAEATSE